MDDPKYSRKYAEGAEKTDIPADPKQAATHRLSKIAYGIMSRRVECVCVNRPIRMASMEVGVTGYKHVVLHPSHGLVRGVKRDDFFLGAEMEAIPTAHPARTVRRVDCSHGRGQHHGRC